MSQTKVQLIADLTQALVLDEQGELRFGDSDGSNYVGFKAAATVSTNRIWTLPAADGTNGQALVTDGSGNFSFADAGGGGASAINDLSDAKTDNSDAAIGLGTGTLAADDGGNSTVAIGKDALNDQTSGNFNCAVGNEALSLVTTVGQNAAFGVFAGRRATGGSNTFIGYSAGEGVSGSSTGYYCTAVGEKAMENFTSGYDHTAIGYRALRNVTTGSDNTALGYQSGDAVTTGSSNTFLGHEAGTTFTTGSNSTAIGHNAQPSSNTVSNEITLGDANVTSLRIPGLQSGASDGQVLTFNSSNGNITLADAGGGGGELQQDSQNNLYAGDSAWQSYTSSTNGHCIAIGETAGQNTTTSNESVFIGRHAGEDVTTANQCIGIGPDCFNNTAGVTGNFNIAISGFLGGGRKLTSGNNNVFIGSRAGEDMTTGASNVCIGDNAGRGSTTATQCVLIGNAGGQYVNGARNISIGNRAGTNVSGADNTIVGSNAQYNTTMSGDNNTLIGHDAFASSTSVSNEITLGDSNIATLRCNVQTISSLSDGRDKINVVQLGEGLDFVSRLKPVKFEWKTRDGNSKDGTYEAGFIAQDLQQAQQDGDAEYLGLVMDSNPDRLEVSYGKLVPVLVRAIQELKAEIDTLKANAIS